MSERSSAGFPHAADTVHAVGQAVVSFQDSRTVLRVADRIPWRISLLTLVLSKCHGRRCKLGTLNLLMWGLQTQVTRELLIEWWQGAPADLATVRSDPRLLATIDLAVGQGLVMTNASGTIILSERGREFAALIDGDVDLLVPEKNLLRDMAPINEGAVVKRLGGALDA